MDVTTKCVIEAKQGFESNFSNHFAIIKVKARNGDQIKINELSGMRYKEIWAAMETPKNEEHPIVDIENLIVFVGGENKISERTLCIIGK